MEKSNTSSIKPSTGLPKTVIPPDLGALVRKLENKRKRTSTPVVNAPIKPSSEPVKIDDPKGETQKEVIVAETAKHPQPVLRTEPDLLERFVPNWRIKKTDSFASDASISKEAISHLSSLDEAENRRKSLEDLAKECYLAQANSFEKSHLFIQKTFELLAAAEEDKKTIASLRASLEKKEEQNAAFVRDMDRVRKELKDANVAAQFERSKVAALEASLKDCQGEVIDLKANLEGGAEVWRRQYLKSERFGEDLEPYMVKAGKDAWNMFLSMGEVRSPGLRGVLEGLHIGCSHPKEKRLKLDGTCVSYVSIGKPWEIVEEGEEASSVPFMEEKSDVMEVDSEGNPLKEVSNKVAATSSTKSLAQMEEEQKQKLLSIKLEKDEPAASKKNGQSGAPKE